MPNANTGIQRGAVQHGARGYLTVGGKTVGYVQSVSWQEGTEFQPLDVLDNLETEEHVPVAYTVSGSVSLVKVVDRSLKRAGIQTPIAQVLGAGTLTIEIKDRPTDQATNIIEGVRFSTKSGNMAKRQITVENLQFVALRMRDESGLV
jgi:hypothetical protein